MLNVIIQLKTVIMATDLGLSRNLTKYVEAMKALPGHDNPFEETGHLCEGALVTPEAWKVT